MEDIRAGLLALDLALAGVQGQIDILEDGAQDPAIMMLNVNGRLVAFDTRRTVEYVGLAQTLISLSPEARRQLEDQIPWVVQIAMALTKVDLDSPPEQLAPLVNQYLKQFAATTAMSPAALDELVRLRAEIDAEIDRQQVLLDGAESALAKRLVDDIGAIDASIAALGSPPSDAQALSELETARNAICSSFGSDLPCTLLGQRCPPNVLAATERLCPNLNDDEWQTRVMCARLTVHCR